ncbi:hypothetical protein ACB092_04G126200 [Castanea dentata]
MMETCSCSHSSPKRLLCDVGSLDVLLKDFMPENAKDAMDLLSQRVLMKFILFHCLRNTSDQTPLPLPLVTENDDTPLEEKKLLYRFRPSWSVHQTRSNLGSSKRHSSSQLPNLNIKRKRFSQVAATADPERVSLLQEEPTPEASTARKIIPRVKIIPPKKPRDMGSFYASSIATADPEKASLPQEEPEPEASAACKIIPRVKIIPPKKPGYMGSSSASSIAAVDPEKAYLLQEEPEPEASATPKTVPRLRIIPPKKPPHLGSYSALPIAIPNDSASVLSKEESPIYKPKRQRINPTPTSRFNHHFQEVEVG